MSGSLTLVLALGTLILLCITMSNIDMIALASSYYILFCQVWLLSIRSLFFSKERQKEGGSGGEGGWEELGGVEEKKLLSGYIV